MTCQEIGQWITDNIEKPLNQWLIDAYRQCMEAKRWLEERRTELEDWRRTQVTRCQEQPCQWLCFCCNKWFCWLVDILVRILVLVIQIIEHVIEAVCKLMVTIIWLVLWVLVQIVKFIVLAVVCILASLCSMFILIGALAALVFLLGILALTLPAFAPLAAPLIPIAIAYALTALALAHLLCEASRCRVLGAIGWALKWAIVVGTVAAIVFLSPLTALIVAIYGGVIAALIIAIEKLPCTLPRMFGLP